jgi:uncharacterized protein YndB with AHSA1/START domain
MYRYCKFIVLPFALLVSSTPSGAEVVDAADGGFTVLHRVTVSVPRPAVYHAAVNDIARWWSSDHTVSGDAANLYIHAVPQGCFCERLGDGAGVAHMTVTFVNPGVMLRLTGGLGPLGLFGVNGNMTFEFDDVESDTDGDADAGSTDVTLRYAVGGYRPGGLAAVAPAVDQVLGEQLARLQGFLEQAGER